MDVRWPTEWLTFVAKALSTGSLRKYQGSEQDVCVIWQTLSGLASIKETVFWNFGLAYLSCRLHPPPRGSGYFLWWGGSLERPGTPPPHFLKIHLNCTPTHARVFQEVCFHQVLLPKPVCTSPVPIRATRPAHPFFSLSDHLNNIWCVVQPSMWHRINNLRRH
jgi:hypothetical protein